MIMNGDDKRSTASLILAKMKDGKSKTQEVKPTVGMGDDEDAQGMRAAAEDLLQAIQDKDPQGLMMALKAFLSLADSDDDEQDQE
jgi:hypothetical protein